MFKHSEIQSFQETEFSEVQEKDNFEFTKKCLKEIEFDGKDMPRLEMNQDSANSFNRLLKLCENTYETPIVCIVRCYNKSKEDINGFLTRFERIKKFIPEIQGVMIAINKEGDKDGQTGKNLDEILKENTGRKDITPIQVKNYSWTAGLNGPAALLCQGAKEKNLNPENMSVFNLSFDTEFDDGALMDFAKQYRANKIVMTNRKEKDQFKTPDWETVKNILKANLSKHDRSLPDIIGNKDFMSMARNTASCFKLSQIKEVGGYNKSCNGIGGMEDHEFTIRIILDALQNKDYTKAKKIIDSIRKPVEYNDIAWDSLSPEKQEAKLLREQKATENVIKSIMTKKITKNNEKYKTQRENQDFKFE